MWWLNHFLRTQERGLLEHALTPAPCVTFMASMFPFVPGGCWASLWGPSWLSYVPKSLTSNLGSWAHTLSKHTRVICPHILIRCGEMQKILLFFSLLCAYTMPVVRAAGSTGGTTTVRRSRAMAMVSCREAWGGRTHRLAWQKAHTPFLAPSPVTPMEFWKLRIVIMSQLSWLDWVFSRPSLRNQQIVTHCRGNDTLDPHPTPSCPSWPGFSPLSLLSTQRATPSLPIRHLHTLWTPGHWD